jgi:hypothetical protein
MECWLLANGPIEIFHLGMGPFVHDEVSGKEKYIQASGSVG